MGKPGKETRRAGRGPWNKANRMFRINKIKTSSQNKAKRSFRISEIQKWFFATKPIGERAPASGSQRCEFAVPDERTEYLTGKQKVTISVSCSSHRRIWLGAKITVAAGGVNEYDECGAAAVTFRKATEVTERTESETKGK